MVKRKRASRASRREQVWRRARGCCEDCQLSQAYDPLPFHIEHIVSKKHKGRTVMRNLALSCSGCNLYKSSNIAGRDAETNKLCRLYHPRNDVWSEHFAWKGPVLIGITAIGRVTIDVLNINHPERVRLRRLLIRLRVFPADG